MTDPPGSDGRPKPCHGERAMNPINCLRCPRCPMMTPPPRSRSLRRPDGLWVVQGTWQAWDAAQAVFQSALRLKKADTFWSFGPAKNTKRRRRFAPEIDPLHLGGEDCEAKEVLFQTTSLTIISCSSTTHITSACIGFLMVSCYIQAICPSSAFEPGHRWDQHIGFPGSQSGSF